MVEISLMGAQEISRKFPAYAFGIAAGEQRFDSRTSAESRLIDENRILEMVASGCELPEVLASLCLFVEAILSGCHCVIYLVDRQGVRLRQAAAPSLPAAFDEPVRGFPIQCASVPFARAACLKTQVIVEDVDSDPLWHASTFGLLCLRHGLRACWSTPIYSLTGQVQGTIGIFQCRPSRPTQIQQNLIAQVAHIAGMAIERGQREAALRRSEAFLAQAQRLSSAGSFAWSVWSGEITWSEQLYRIFEFDQGLPLTFELIGSRVHPEDMSIFNEMSGRVRDIPSRDFSYELRLLMPDRSTKYLHLVAHATRDQYGQVEYIGAVLDMTQRRLAEEALGKARSELAHVSRITTLGTLTASIAHEVNQPLSGIITNASTCLRMLDADPPNVEGARETAIRTLRDGNRASEVIARLRALFAKNTAMTEAVDLNEAAREVVVLSLSDLQRRRVILRLELAEDLPHVTGDRVQLQQVILNLLLNAADAMSGVEDRPRHMTIKTVRDEGDRLRLSVQDLGIGFDPHCADLFEPFYTTKSDGMGIGLSVSRFIIESHCGNLWATRNEGPGATFSFSIPCGPKACTYDGRELHMMRQSR
jgi:signal transduction histidine kinase